MVAEPTLFEYFLLATLVIGYTAIAIGPIRKITDDVAGLTWTLYYGPIHVSVLFFAAAGFDNLLGGLMALWMLTIGAIGSYRSGLFKLMPSFPDFSRIACYMAPAYPVAALIFYYALGPWEKGDFWTPVGFFLITLVLSAISGFVLRHSYPFDPDIWKKGS
jgi:hypothetical protein